MVVQTAYISASTNRHPYAADISDHGVIAAGSSNLIGLWDITDEYDRGIMETLPGHPGLVTAVRFVSGDIFVSADDRGNLRAWRKQSQQWISSGHIQAHKQAISTLAVHQQCIATGASDATVKIWTLVSSPESETFEEVQVLDLHGKYALSLAMAELPRSQAVAIAIGSTDRNVQVWVRSDRNFSRSAVLPGHEDWVRSLAFQTSTDSQDSLILASGSQDCTVRLWNIEVFNKDISALTRPEEGLSDALLDAFEASLGDLADSEEGGRQISLKRHILTVKGSESEQQQFSITFDALLVGHEGGITSLTWRRSQQTSRPTLLSTSTDSSIILWSPSSVLASSGNNTPYIWINRQRFGDVGGQRLGGFVGGLWAHSDQEVLAWGWSGGWRRWRCTLEKERTENETWSETGAISGHNGPVRDLNWAPHGQYLISVSLDQTTRIHSPIKIEDIPVVSWHELGRPQVHGYDLLGVAFLNNLQFISIADEKVARVFDAHRGFLEITESLKVAEFSPAEHQRPAGANVPPLGLSNKATVDEEQHQPDEATPAKQSARRPFEGELASATLWPEIEKVFGHGYESMSLTVSNDGRLIATSCKATTAEHAVVRIYDTNNWQPFGQPLAGHTLTVTRIAFSPDGRFIVSVSRDRSWRLYERSSGDGYIQLATDKSHTRIIWDCAWAHEGDVFATASRDKTVKLWKTVEGKYVAIHTFKTPEAATAVSFSPANEDNVSRRLAIGLETGEILVYWSNLNASPISWELLVKIDSRMAHVNQIHRLAWRPKHAAELASCSEDGTLKVLFVQEVTRLNYPQ